MNPPGRNGPCPCGSGKKFKRCCGAQPAAMAAAPASRADARALFVMGQAAQLAGNDVEAIEYLTQAVAAKPKFTDALVLLGNLCQAGGRVDEALRYWQRALEADSGLVDVRNHLAAVLVTQKRFDEAIAHLRQVIARKPAFANAHGNLGAALLDTGRREEAEATLRRALELDPKFPEAHFNLAKALIELGRLEEGEQRMHQAIAVRPNYGEAECCLSAMQSDQGRLDEAEQHARRGIELGFFLSLMNLGSILLDKRQYADATIAYRIRLAVDPNDYLTRFNVAQSMLLEGRFDEGWAAFEDRFGQRVAKRLFPQPFWNGEDLAGKSLLIWGEQGLGDEVMFAGLFAEAMARAGRVVIECMAKLAPLFAASFPAAQVVAISDPPHPATLEGIDFQVAAASLGRIFRPNLASFPERPGYLRPAPQRIAHWRDRLARLPGLKVGICWRSSDISGARALECSRLDQWGAILGTPGVSFVNLQYDDCGAELAQARARFGVEIHEFPEVDLFDDLLEAAALTQAMDLVISAPTSVSILAAALGVPTWQMSCRTDWQTLGLDYNPWFPSIRRIPRHWQQSWEQVFGLIAPDLAQLARDRHAVIAKFQEAAPTPAQAETLHLLGQLSHQLGEYRQAIRLFKRALASREDAGFHNDCGLAHAALGEYDQAVDHYRQAVGIAPDFLLAHNNMGVALRAAGKPAEAVLCYRRAIALDPKQDRLHNNLGNALRDTDALDESAAALRVALALNPNSPDSWLNLGRTQMEQGKYADAESSYRRTLSLTPQFAPAHLELGNALSGQLRIDEALACHRRALSLDPQDERARANIGALLLLRGELAEGWAYFENRQAVVGSRGYTQPAWRGEDLSGKKLLVWGEQGIGDEILYASLFPDLVRRAGTCVIECKPKLLPLFSRSFPGAHFIPQSDPPHPDAQGPFDYQSPAGNLARWLRPGVASFPAHHGYLIADPARVAHWRGQLARLGPGLKVGIGWRSSNTKGARALSCTRLDQWGPILKVPGMCFIKLQYDDCAAELQDASQRYGIRIHEFPDVDLFDDLDEAAALTRAMDLVIAAPTSVGILSAALGVATWQMSFGPDWQTLGTDRQPWFPAMRQFVRPWNQSWDTIINQIALELHQRLLQ